MTAMALLVATTAIQRDTALEKHHATSGGDSAQFMLHHAVEEPGGAPFDVVRTVYDVTADVGVQAVDQIETAWNVGVTRRGDWASRGCRGPDPPHSDGTRTGCW
jgi:hypothetical protein